MLLGIPNSGCSQCRRPAASQSRRTRDSNPPGPPRESQQEPQRDSPQDRSREEREAQTTRTGRGIAALLTANGSRNSPAPRVHLSGIRQHLMRLQRDNSIEVERAVNEDGWKVVQRRRRQRAHRQERGILDPVQEGPCFRCLSQEHYASTCRSPIRCRLCRREGHRHAHCPLMVQGQEEKHGRVVKDLSLCLVGVT